MLSIGDGVTDDVLEEDLEDTTGLLVDQTGDTLDTTTASKTTNSLSDINVRDVCPIIHLIHRTTIVHKTRHAPAW